MDYKARCIWVVGASSGIGRALAHHLANEGNFVIASARRREALDELALGAKGRIKPLTLDVTCDAEALTQARQRMIEVTDYLDAIIYCAGVCEYEDSLSLDFEKYQRAMDVNMLGAVKMLHIGLPLLKRSSITPQVALVGSLSSVVGFPRAEAYGASKAALEYFAWSLKADCANLPVDIRLIRPGFVETPMTAQNDFAMPWAMTPEQAAKAIVKGLRGKSFVVDFPWRLSALLGLFKRCPFIWFRFFAPKMTRHQAKHWSYDQKFLR